MKKRLFTPGPTPVPEHVLLTMAEPIIHHRHPEFRELFERLSKNLQYLFQTSQDVISLTSSGSGSMEAAVVNLLSPGDTAITVNGGKFGERWGELCRANGVNAVEIAVEWGTAVTADEIVESIKAHPETKAVFVTHSETSTGVAIDVKTIAQAVHANSGAVFVVDGITAVGALEMRMDEWGLDVVVTGSQKGLMIPPGLAFIALSEKAWKLVESSHCHRYYFDLLKARKSLKGNDTPWTPATTLLIGVDVALEMIRKETLEKVWERHSRLAAAVRAGVQALGLRLLAKSPSNALTAIWNPEVPDVKVFNNALKKKYGITVAGGQGHLKDKIFRISHLGYYDELDVLSVIGAIELSLRDAGYVFEPGAGVKAAQTVFLNESW
ncbi:MAG: aminotransferase [Ignavibacteriales bacterium CG07_land_8_20_14_0_80_59_12]|nr:MAG: aminotransferase [Ignavibacteriales bacterium CG07_land_8_20_14_0_80_59_12]